MVTIYFLFERQIKPNLKNRHWKKTLVNEQLISSSSKDHGILPTNKDYKKPWLFISYKSGICKELIILVAANYWILIFHIPCLYLNSSKKALLQVFPIYHSLHANGGYWLGYFSISTFTFVLGHGIGRSSISALWAAFFFSLVRALVILVYSWYDLDFILNIWFLSS